MNVQTQFFSQNVVVIILYNESNYSYDIIDHVMHHATVPLQSFGLHDAPELRNVLITLG